MDFDYIRNRFESGNRLLATSALLLAVFMLPACVSDTLSQQDTQPQTLAETPSYDPVQREQAVAEIREKAEQEGSGELTNAFAEPDGPNEPMNSSEQAQLINELEQNAQQNSNAIPDAELEAKQRSIRELQQKARSHYNNAVNNIQN